MRTSKIISSSRSGLLTDSYPMVWDIKKSHGSYLHTVDGDKYLSFQSDFGSNTLGYNHTKMVEKYKNFDKSILINKPSNSDFYTKDYFDFLDAFKKHAVPEGYDYTFFIDGGALAVENAMNAAFNWKAQLLIQKGIEFDVNNLSIIHPENAFNGRSGYTKSSTNTDPHKVLYCPKFNWPRIYNIPYLNLGLSQEEQVIAESECLDQMKRYIQNAKLANNKDNTIAAFIIEPIQCEGGDLYMSKLLLQGMERLCHDNDILFIVDEVQTGYYASGKKWCYENYDLNPDIVVFGKKTQQCGIFASGKNLDKIQNHVFNTSGWINSTWGGHLCDMDRWRKIDEVVREDKLGKNAYNQGKKWIEWMSENISSNHIGKYRNSGLIMAFDCDTTETRNKLLDIMFHKHKFIALSCGEKSIRFRPNLAVTDTEMEDAMNRTKKSIQDLD